MITIGKVHMDFCAADEEFACELYSRWDRFFRNAVEKVADDILSVYDRPDEIVRISCLEVEVGKIAQEVFYERFPLVWAEKLRETFLLYLNDRQKYAVERITLKRDCFRILVFFLSHGYFPPDTPVELNLLSELLHEVLDENGKRLVGYIRSAYEKQDIYRRLVFQFTDDDLVALVRAAEPVEALFIRLYVHYLQLSREQIERPEINATDYRNAIWEVVLAYLFFESRSFFSRRQIVSQTIHGLASRFNLSYPDLLRLLASGFEKFAGEWVFVPELLVILSALQTEWDQKLPHHLVDLPELLAQGGMTHEQKEMLYHLLMEPESCRSLLSSLTEKEIEELVGCLMPAESPFIIQYARELEHEKERGMLEGETGPEFRLLKWEFIFQTLLAMPSAAFERRHFVLGVIRRMAAHYNLWVESLLFYLWADLRFLPSALAEVLQQIYNGQMEDCRGKAISFKDRREYTEADREQWIFLLSHPVSARQLLQTCTEKQIRRLVEVIIPSESTFIIRYALSLDREQEKGMLEGKAGPEFRLLKWEFIFTVVLSSPFSAFERKQFVRAVLHQIAAHYNVEAFYLLHYFYKAISRQESIWPAGMTQWIGELWQEEQFRFNRWTAVDDTEFEETFRVWDEQPFISGQAWQEVGIDFFRLLLMNYQVEEKALFIRRYKKEIAGRLFRVAEFREILQELVYLCGFLTFLSEMYGRDYLAEVFAGIAPEARQWFIVAGLGKMGDFLRLTAGEKTVWLKNDPARVSLLWEKASPTEREQLYSYLSGHPEMGKIWIRQLGGKALRLFMEKMEEWSRCRLSFPPEKIWLSWMYPLTDPAYADAAEMEIRIDIARKIKVSFPALYPELMAVAETAFVPQIKTEKYVLSNQKDKMEKKTEQFFIGNAGMVLLMPYVPRLFRLLEYTDNGGFVNDEMQVRAVFVLQYLLDEEREYAEHELVLNKLFAGYPLTAPLPRRITLHPKEKEMAGSLLSGVMQNWEMMKNTSVQGFRNSFLIRNGILQETGEFWQLAVEEKAYDMLLDALLWSFSPLCFPWMKKPVYVNWRNKN